MTQSVLFIDDDPAILDSLGRYLERVGYDVLPETTGKAGVATFRERRPDVVLLDLRLPDADDFSILRQLREMDAAVVLLTGHGDIETAVEAMRLGAEHFLTKPVEVEHLNAVLARVAEKSRLVRENERLRRRETGEGGLDALGSSPEMTELAERVRMFAESDRTTILLTGESGTGKGWLARIIHQNSERAQGPFVELNCAGLTSTFLASELFGHEKGAFTDAKERRAGLFRQAEGGTLLLDEVGDLTLDLQPRLLRVLETKTFRRLGGDREVTADVRLLAATNRNLTEKVEEGAFREDLFYRLNVAPIHLPPLRERTPEDRLVLLNQLLRGLSMEMAGSPGRIGDDALALLMEYHWPGNIRELRNVLERALIFAAGSEEILPKHLPSEVRNHAGVRARGRGTFEPESLEEVERRHVERMLVHHKGNRTHAANDLGIARTTLIQKIKKYGLEV